MPRDRIEPNCGGRTVEIGTHGAQRTMNISSLKVPPGGDEEKGLIIGGRIG
jgi:hypothetical protein